MNPGPGVPIVCFSAVDWDYITMREHHLLGRLARRHPVLYVEAPSHPLSLVKRPRKGRKLWQWIRRPRQVAENVWVYTPPLVLPFGRVFFAVNALNQWIIQRLVRRAARTLRFERSLLWLYEPEQFLQVGRHRERLVVYDCADRHDAFARLQRPAVVRQMEARLCDRADVILTVSEALTRAIGSPRAHLVRNGADLGVFRQTLYSDLAPADDLGSLPRPILGYVGTIDERVDVGLLVQTAQALPAYSFVFVGPIEVDVARLRRLPNVRILGRRPYELLPRYLKGFDACLLPFRMSDLTMAGCPIKLYDYLAAGKMVVATDVPEARRFRLGVLIARSADEFVGLARDAPRTGVSPHEISAQMEGESWEERADAVRRILDRYLETSRPVAAT